MSHPLISCAIQTPFGDMLAAATDMGICLLEFTDRQRLEMQLPRLQKLYKTELVTGNCYLLEQLQGQLNDYFNGKRKRFDLPLDLKGTPFQLTAWSALSAIPYGETRSYQEQASSIGNPKAFRAVASANRNNRLSILIPCHRVIAKNGQLAGYGGGLDRKEFLINLEKQHKKITNK